MGPAQLVGALLCQRYGGKLIFGISNIGLGVLSCMTPLAASFGVVTVIVIRALQGIVGVNIGPSFPYLQQRTIGNIRVNLFLFFHVQGIGIGVAAKSLISKWVPPNERAKFLAIMSGNYHLSHY